MQRLRQLAQPKGRQAQGSAQEGVQGEGLPDEVLHAAEDALRIPGEQQGQGEHLVLPKKKRVIDTMREIGAAAQVCCCGACTFRGGLRIFLEKLWYQLLCCDCAVDPLRSCSSC